MTLAPLCFIDTETDGLHPGRQAWEVALIRQAMALGYLACVHHGLKPNVGITPPWKSDVLATACGVEPPAAEERHTALGDARWAMRWYDTIFTGGATS